MTDSTTHRPTIFHAPVVLKSLNFVLNRIYISLDVALWNACACVCPQCPWYLASAPVTPAGFGRVASVSALTPPWWALNKWPGREEIGASFSEEKVRGQTLYKWSFTQLCALSGFICLFEQRIFQYLHCFMSWWDKDLIIIDYID